MLEIMRHILIKGKNISTGARDFFKPSPNIWDLPDLYPDSVYFQFQNLRISAEDQKPHAMMGQKEMRSLLDRGYPDLSFYLLAKTKRDESGLENFLNRSVAAYFSGSSENTRFLSEEIEHLHPDVLADGTKLGQIARAGISRWRDRWRETAERFANEEPVYLLSTPLVGFGQILDASKTSGKPFYLASVKWHSDPSRNYQGFIVDLEDSKKPVKLQLKTDDRPSCNAVLIDDTDRKDPDRKKVSDFDLVFNFRPPDTRPTRKFAITTVKK